MAKQRKPFGFYVLLALLYPIAILPYPVLYALGYCSYVCMYYLWGYRKDVVRSNLRRCFPDKDDAWLKRIEKQHYKWFANNFVEIIKGLVMSEKTAAKRCRFDDDAVDVFRRLIDEGEPDVLAVAGHYGNWEWAGISVSTKLPYDILGVYKPIKAQAIDALFHYSRARFGMRLIPMAEARSTLENSRGGGYLTLLLSDQSPGKGKGDWFEFMGQPTAVFMGAERLAKKHNVPVIFGSIRLVKRGYYEIHVELVTDAPRDLPEGELTRRHVQMLERELRRDPVPWLWSHKRWKRSPTAGK